MNRRIVGIFTIIILLLALIVFFTHQQYNKIKKQETFVNTQTCLKLSSDEISTATKICNNGKDADNSSIHLNIGICIIIIY